MNSLALRFGTCVWLATLSVLQVYAAEPAQRQTPLFNVVLAPELKAAADKAHIDLSSMNVQSPAPAQGDSVVFWVGATHGNKKEQWLIQLKRGLVTPEERKSHPSTEVKKYLCASMGGHVALEAFYNLANDVPALKEIAEIVVERPAAWKLAKLALGGNFITYFGGENTSLIEPVKAGLLPVASETFQVPVSFALEDDLIVNSFMAVTASAPPLDVSAGILALAAFHPKDQTRMV